MSPTNKPVPPLSSKLIPLFSNKPFPPSNTPVPSYSNKPFLLSNESNKPVPSFSNISVPSSSNKPFPPSSSKPVPPSSSRPVPSSSTGFDSSIFVNSAIETYERRAREDLSMNLGSVGNTPDEFRRLIHNQARDLDVQLSTMEVLSGNRPFPSRMLYFLRHPRRATRESKSNSHEVIMGLLKRIESFIARLELYIKIPPTPEMINVVTEIMAEILFAFVLVNEQTQQGRFRRKAFEETLQRLDTLAGEESQMIVTRTLEVVSGLLTRPTVVIDDPNGSRDNTRQTQALVQRMERMERMEVNVERNRLQHDIQRWLFAPDPWRNHNVARKTRHYGTATWFTQGKTFNEWKSTGSVLWIHGISGSGKTVFCSTIIQDVWSMCQAGLANLAFFYFDHRDTAQLDARTLLSSLLVQLYNQSDYFREVLTTVYMAHDCGSRQPGEEELLQCLRDMVSQGKSPVYIIIDALDECPDSSGLASPRAEVLEIIRRLSDISSRVYLCIASRLETDIRRVIKPLTSHIVSLDKNDGHHKDIAEYVKFIVHSDPTIGEWPEGEKRLIIDTLTHNCGGMFRWASCQLETLRHTPLQSIRRILREFPKALDETYERTLRVINKKWEYSHRIFQCLMVSARPLRVEELAEVFTVEVDAESTGIPEFNAHWRHKDPEEAVLSACSCLVSTVELHGERIVQFSHFSVQQFLTSDRIANSKDVSNFHLLLEPAHTFLARACLSLLLQPDERKEKRSIHYSPLHFYAAKHWVDHAQFGDVSSIIQEGMERLFDRDKPHFSEWIRTYNLDHPQGSPLTPFAVPLYYAALCGFYDLAARLLITHPQDVNARGGRHVTPLHAALVKGHIKVAHLLLQHDADESAQDDHHYTPLHLAAECGDPVILRSLINHGANPNAQNKDQETPLFLASRKGRLEAARLLSEQVTDVDHQDSLGRSPLHVAAENGHHDIARLLLDRGADVNAPEKNLRTPLHLAAEQGKLAVAQLLLERGAEVDARDEMDWTPLHFASQQGYVELMQLLLENGVDVLARDSEDQTALHVASEQGDPEILRSLINHGADPDALNKDQETPLFLASRKGRLEAARLLSEHVTDVNHQDSLGRTPLHVAAENGHHDIAHLLLDRGADVNAPEKNLRTPLHLAAEQNMLAVAHLLLERDAEVDACDEMKWTPLHFASQHGHLDLVSLLLEHHADVLAPNDEGRTFLDLAWERRHKEIVDVNAQYEDRQTALHIASQHGNTELMRWIIDHNEKILDAEDEDQETPLFPASRNGKLDATQLLLDAGADVNHQDWQGMTPLHGASENGHDAVSQLLLERKAEVDAEHVYHWTPLHLASRAGKDRVAKVLLDEGGANVDAKNDSAWTPLHMASQKGHLNVVELLLVHHADVDARKADEETALHLAAFYGKLEVARVLLNNRADPCPENKKGETPFNLASREGHDDIAQLLKDMALVRKYGGKLTVEQQVGEMVAQ